MRPLRALTASRLRLAVTIAALLCVLVAVVPLARHRLLQALGGLLIFSDLVTAADVIVITPESGFGGALEASDLYQQRIAPALVVLVSEPTAVDAELLRRGLIFPSITDVLVQLGIQRSAVTEVPAGEGGTSENTAALGAWVREHPDKTLLVIVGAAHSGRYRRALSRVWPRTRPMATIVVTPYGLFRKEDWWRSRQTLRDGLVELEKLGLDYVRHPF